MEFVDSPPPLKNMILFLLVQGDSLTWTSPRGLKRDQGFSGSLAPQPRHSERLHIWVCKQYKHKLRHHLQVHKHSAMDLWIDAARSFFFWLWLQSSTIFQFFFWE